MAANFGLFSPIQLLISSKAMIGVNMLHIADERPHVLARNMGTSIPMIERHYSHLKPRMKKEMLSGPDYGLTREEYLAQKAANEAD